MTLLQARTTKVALCVVVFSVASGFATVIPVTNPSFEDTTGVTLTNCGSGCGFSTNVPVPGWTFVGSGNFGQFQPGTQLGDHTFFNSLPAGDGITNAYSNGGTFSQTVGQTVQEGEIYTLTVDLGQRNDVSSFLASADLLVSGTKSMATGTPPPLGGWSTFTARFVGTEANEGEPITIQLNSSGSQGNFDSVSLTSVPVPEPSSMLLLGSGVLLLVQGLRRKLL